MVYRPKLFYGEASFINRKLYPHSPFVNGPQAMNISQPLSRASHVAEIDFQRLFHDNQSRQRQLWGDYRGHAFPSIPRPKQTAFFYSSWSKNGKNLKLPGLHLSKRGLVNAPLRLKSKTKSLHRRFFSDEARRLRRERRRFVRWWTLTSLTVVLGGVAAKIMYEKGHYEEDDDGMDPFTRYTVKPQSWHLYAYSTLPLKAMSRLWGQFNSINLPVWLRSPSYRLYSTIFGVNLEEMDEPDLSTYPNLSEFFYRKLKPGVRPLSEAELVSPSDGTVLKFGVIENGEIEQVKGMTYSIDALLGLSTKRLAAPTHLLEFDHDSTHEAVIRRDQEFANLNGISYTMDDIVGGQNKNTHHKHDLEFRDKGDGTAENSKPSLSKNLYVAQNMATNPLDLMDQSSRNLYFAVIYLAPGDYHRYHSPTNWVTTLRRHFIGELFSVAPFFQKTLQGLFVLNERVALLGYWKYGFFSMIPVGATNVGSIVVNFDKDLKTNVIYEHEVYLRKSSLSSISDEQTPLLKESTDELDTAGSTSSQTSDSGKQIKPKKLRKNTVYEATYTGASSLLGGFPLSKGEEVGGFKLGSTVVLVFEAPDTFKFDLEVGQKIKMGKSLGNFM